MALHLVTGYAGREHITSQDQGTYNIATFGDGNMVLDRGQKFKHTVLSNNSIKIADGEALMQGRYIKMPMGTTEDVNIENGSQGKQRIDLICIRYEKSAVDATESAKLVVIKGTEGASGSMPSYNDREITDGTATIADFPLYSVHLNGINISEVKSLFEVVVPMAKYMKEYQLPTASKTVKGGVMVGNGLDIAGGAMYVKKTDTATSGNSDAITSGGVYNALTDGSVTKVGKATVGSATKPVYLNNGIPTAGKSLRVFKFNMSASDTVSAESEDSIGINEPDIINKIATDFGITISSSDIIGISLIRGIPNGYHTGRRFISEYIGKSEVTTGDGSTVNAYNVLFHNLSSISEYVESIQIELFAYA